MAAQKEDMAIQATSAKLEQERHAVIVEEHARRAGGVIFGLFSAIFCYFGVVSHTN